MTTATLFRQVLCVLFALSSACGSVPGHGETAVNSGASSAPPDCATLASNYASALSAAQACVSGTASCNTLRPVPLYQDVNGQRTLQGLCTCLTVVNGANSGQLDAALSAFHSAGCTESACPCPANPPAVPATCDGHCGG